MGFLVFLRAIFLQLHMESLFRIVPFFQDDMWHNVKESALLLVIILGKNTLAPRTSIFACGRKLMPQGSTEMSVFTGKKYELQSCNKIVF